MRFLIRSIIGLGLVVLALGLLLAAGWIIRDARQPQEAQGGRPGQGAEERVFTAAVLTITPSEIAPILTAYGEVRALRSVELRAGAAGEVIWLAEGLADGRAVKAGEVLLRIDPAEAQAARDLATADLARAQAEADESTRALTITRDELTAAQAQAELRAQALTRQRDLLARGIGSDAAVETAALAASSADQAVLSQRSAVSQGETAVALAATAVDQARIALDQAERALAETEVKATFDGLLDTVTVGLGGKVSAGEVLAQLIDPGALEVAFRVPTAAFGALVDENGQVLPLKTTARLDSGSAALTAQGQLTRAGAAVGSGQTGRLVYAALDGRPPLRPGDFVTLSIGLRPLTEATTLPAAAIGGDGQLLVLGLEDRLESAEALVLHRQGDDVIIDARALAGREVIRNRTALLGAGIKVNPVRPDDAAAVQLDQGQKATLLAQIQTSTSLDDQERAEFLKLVEEGRVTGAALRDLQARLGG
jgi:multidrug efflux pump subunit AcrA (membrane-fusion protein)